MSGSLEFVEHHAQECHVRGEVAGLDVADGAGLGFDGVDEVGPEELHVVRRRALELVVLVDRGLLGIDWVGGPAVSPAHVEHALGAVEVAADAVLLGASNLTLPDVD